MHSPAPSQHRLTTPGEVVLGAPRRPRVLVIEDHELARRALGALLSTMGYEVVEATNGREALMTLATEGPPDVILLDLVMPIMDGWEFMKRQRRDWRLCTIPTIVISGVPSHDPRCLEMPIVRFLPKPYTIEQLMAAIHAECSPPPARNSA